MFKMVNKKSMELEKRIGQLERIMKIWKREGLKRIPRWRPEKLEPTDIVIKFETLEDKDKALEVLSYTNCQPYIFKYLCVSKSAEKTLREKEINFRYPNNEDQTELTRGTPEYQKASSEFRKHFFEKYKTNDPREI